MINNDGNYFIEQFRTYYENGPIDDCSWRNVCVCVCTVYDDVTILIEKTMNFANIVSSHFG